MVTKGRDRRRVGGPRRAPEAGAGGGRAPLPPLARLQQQAGNRAVGQVLARAASDGHTPSEPRAASLGALLRRSGAAPDALLAGTATRRDAPDGIAQNRAASATARGVPAGLTQYAGTDEFGVPSIDVDTRRTDAGVVGTLQPTQARDATHQAWYAGPGEHAYTDAQGMDHVVYVDPDLSDDLRTGEEEHLGDVARAYRCTLGRVAMVVNDMAGQQFGPASTEHGVRQQAEAAVAARIAPLRPHPGHWMQMLIALMRQSRLRDDRLWHLVSPVAATEHPDLHARGVEVLVRAPTFAVDVHPPSEVVNYPSD